MTTPPVSASSDPRRFIIATVVLTSVQMSSTFRQIAEPLKLA
jgi:hypothetical protein